MRVTVLHLVNARLAGRPDRPVDVLLADGHVAAVVPTGAPLPGDLDVGYTGPERVDLDGRTVIPGLWDAHTHLTQWAMVRRRLDVSTATGPAHAAALVGAALTDERRHPAPGRPFVGFGFRWATWDDEPTSEVLDYVAGEVPVILISGDLHSAWASTAGLRYLGIEHHPTGLLREEEWMPASPEIVTVSAADADELLADAARAAAERGVVGVVDFEVDDNLTAWRRRAMAGWDLLRVRAAVWEQHLDAVVDAGLHTGDVLAPGSGPAADLITQGPLKVISDGSLNTLTAFCFDDYAGFAGPDAHGILNVATDQLVPLMTHAHASGLRCAIHAIGDHANALALDAFEASRARGSVEHAQMLQAEDVARFAALGITASVQPEHAMDDRDASDELWVGRTERAFRLADLHAAGVPLALGSDAPVAPLDPWFAIASAVTRSRDGRDPWHPEQRIDVATALAASTDGRGVRVRPGDPADLAVLELDPLTLSDDGTPTGAAVLAEVLRELPVAGTLVAGRWTYRGF
ncbi:amidohydrolase family protein [Isoptericola sp. b408]|nr:MULTISPECIES: amidohydrolase family protein [unclassified Isoptericola]MDO8143573.1 amidohydrolase family protein [Isoptericola sp. 178]MDO8147439.1 amidohydrolase family protein [Isoptericola sp. b515]MDO8150252.1 amidohydrolase family protein [Isoptericola sp. b408]